MPIADDFQATLQASIKCTLRSILKISRESSEERQLKSDRGSNKKKLYSTVVQLPASAVDAASSAASSVMLGTSVTPNLAGNVNGMVESSYDLHHYHEEKKNIRQHSNAAALSERQTSDDAFLNNLAQFLAEKFTKMLKYVLPILHEADRTSIEVAIKDAIFETVGKTNFLLDSFQESFFWDAYHALSSSTRLKSIHLPIHRFFHESLFFNGSEIIVVNNSFSDKLRTQIKTYPHAVLFAENIHELKENISGSLGPKNTLRQKTFSRLLPDQQNIKTKIADLNKPAKYPHQIFSIIGEYQQLLKNIQNLADVFYAVFSTHNSSNISALAEHIDKLKNAYQQIQAGYQACPKKLKPTHFEKHEASINEILKKLEELKVQPTRSLSIPSSSSAAIISTSKENGSPLTPEEDNASIGGSFYVDAPDEPLNEVLAKIPETPEDSPSSMALLPEKTQIKSSAPPPSNFAKRSIFAQKQNSSRHSSVASSCSTAFYTPETSPETSPASSVESSPITQRGRTICVN